MGKAQLQKGDVTFLDVGCQSTLIKPLISIFSDWDDIAEKTETYNAGASAHIKCSYPDNHENKEKFLCKGQNPLNCVKVIHTTEQDRDVDKGRFDIRDNRRLKYFYVNIRNLHTADSGTYWCGSDGTWQHDKYTKILLSVGEYTEHCSVRL